MFCSFCGYEVQEGFMQTHINERHPNWIGSGNQTPPGQGKRDKIRPRHDLIPLEFLDEIASIFEEGRKPRPGLPEGYGDSWKRGGDEFLRDCLNHASNHLFSYMNGDYSENQLAKVAWNVLAIRWHDLRRKGIAIREIQTNDDNAGTTQGDSRTTQDVSIQQRGLHGGLRASKDPAPEKDS